MATTWYQILSNSIGSTAGFNSTQLMKHIQAYIFQTFIMSGVYQIFLVNEFRFALSFHTLMFHKTVCLIYHVNFDTCDLMGISMNMCL